MTNNDFERLSVERDRNLGQGLHHQGSLIRRDFRDWIVQEIKELQNELERRSSTTNTIERTRLSKIKGKLEEFDNTKRQESTEETTTALEDAKNSVWARVDEPCLKVFEELRRIAQYVGELAALRDEMGPVPADDDV